MGKMIMKNTNFCVKKEENVAGRERRRNNVILGVKMVYFDLSAQIAK